MGVNKLARRHKAACLLLFLYMTIIVKFNLLWSLCSSNITLRNIFWWNWSADHTADGCASKKNRSIRAFKDIESDPF